MPPDTGPPPTDAAFALALLGLDGVGRVTAHRLLERYPTAGALRAVPREQVLVRLKGAPRAERTVGLLFGDALDAALDAARAEVEALAAKRIAVLVPGATHWPAGLDGLDRAHRPVVLMTFGDPSVLAGPTVALLARPPLPVAAFEAAQDLVRRLLAEGIAPVAATQSGFDVVVHKLATGAGAPSVAVAHSGLATLPPAQRPGVAALVRAGGVLVSPFALRHGPFDHDDGERALVQSALSKASAFVAPRADTPEQAALSWALDAARPTFAFPDDDAEAEALDPRVHRLDAPVDTDWLLHAARDRESDRG